jgi:polyhydroxybutyrate depolymerase
MCRFIPGLTFSILSMVLFAAVAAAERVQLPVNGQVRTFLLEQPAGQGRRPTIIMLHFAGGSADAEAQLTGLAQLETQNGFAVVFPEGRGGRWNYFPPGKEPAQLVQAYQPHGGVPDDVAFIKLLIADLIQRGISDPKRIYLAGRSAGAIMPTASAKNVHF